MMLLFQIFLSVDILLLLSSLANETETENENFQNLKVCMCIFLKGMKDGKRNYVWSKILT